MQLLKALGVRRVVTAATTAGTIAWVKSLGADVVVDYMEQSALDSVAVRTPHWFCTPHQQSCGSDCLFTH